MKRKTFSITCILVWIAIGVAPAQDSESPARPSGLKAVKRFKGAIAKAELTWIDGSDNELGFEILRSDNGALFQVVGIVGANSDRYIDEIGKYVTGAFSYRVQGFNKIGKGGISNTVSLFF